MKQSNDEPIKTANEQKAHNKYWNDLRKVSVKAADTLGVMHTLYVGVQYHATQVKVCAPNRKEALEMMIGIIERVLDDDKITYGKENGLSEMHTYYFSELQNRNSFKQAEKISAASLSDAQRIALSNQMFQGTVIEIGDNVNDDGFILNPTCVHENGRWDYVGENNQ